MSDLEQLRKMLAPIGPAKEAVVVSASKGVQAAGNIILTVENTGEDGYCGFFSEWTFDKDGALISVANWE